MTQTILEGRRGKIVSTENSAENCEKNKRKFERHEAMFFRTIVVSLKRRYNFCRCLSFCLSFYRCLSLFLIRYSGVEKRKAALKTKSFILYNRPHLIESFAFEIEIAGTEYSYTLLVTRL